ncbi:MAG: hypothetical protein JW801_03340 [Bacteroidales bacterium]|nr:hypothetical protein [Bacteroidales bacterium]
MLRRILKSIVLLAITLGLSAQPVELKLTSVGKEKGLSNSNSTCITQDSLGYIWIGTQEGLNRYNGFNVKVYKHVEGDKCSLPDNTIRQLYTDHTGRIWIGTNKGLCYYEPRRECFEQIALPLIPPEEISELVTHITESPVHGILFSIGHRLYVLDPELKNAEVFITVIEGDISSFLIDDEDDIWISAAKGGGLYRYSGKGNVIERYKKDADNDNSLSSNSILSIAIRNKTELWIATEDEGLNRLDLNTGRITRYPFASYDEKFTRYVYVDRNNFLWLGDHTGLKVFDDTRKEFYSFYSDQNDDQSIKHNAYKVFQDVQKNYWILYQPGGVGVSTQLKGFKVFSDNQNQTWHTMNKNVSAVQEDPEGNLWLANPFNGIDVFHWVRNMTIRFRHDAGNPNSLGSGAVFVMEADYERKGMWIGTHRGGLQFIDSRLEKFTSYLNKPNDRTTILGDDVRDIIIDSKGKLWLAVHGHGVDRMDPATGVFEHFTRNKNNLANEWTNQVLEDHLGNIWVGTSYGISRLPQGEDQFVNYFADERPTTLSGNDIVTIFQDSLFRVWVGTSQGLNLYNRERDNFEPVRGVLGDESICSILDDSENTLWIGTLNGLYHYDPAKGKTTRFDESDGLPSSEFNVRACYKNLYNDLFFGTINGVVLFDPNDLKYNKTVPKVILSGFRLFNNEITKYGPSEPLDEPISFADEVRLEHDENMITFEFLAISMIHPEKNEYAYKLEGFDEEWHYIGTKNEAIYTNLDPGKYTFRVKASNNDGKWNQTGASIQVIVYPPWWQTIWFRALFILIVITAFLLVFYLRTNQLKRQKLGLEKKVKQSTIELQDKNKQLLEKSNHLNEVNTLLEERQQEIMEKSVKLQEMITSKDRLFSIIAHDLTSPFNAIMGFSELFHERHEEMDEQEKKELAGLINDSAKRVYSLLDNLLNWARTQTNRIKYDPEELDIENIFKEAIEVYNFRIVKKQIEVILDKKTNKKPYADVDMIRSVARNLLSNATKYTPEKGKITISIEQDREEVRISITDTGIGISKEVYNNLFNLDKSSSQEGTDGEKGSGIGLILTNEFIGLNGGTLSIRSKEGVGSTFSFTLPVIKT